MKLFQMLPQLPLTKITSIVGIVLVVVFFVTSSDSGSLVIDTIAVSTGLPFTLVLLAACYALTAQQAKGG